MYLLTLLMVCVVGYLPPFWLADSLAVWLRGERWNVLGIAFHPFAGLTTGTTLIIGYLVVAGIAAWLVRFASPARKPAILRHLCMPDQLGALNLVLLLLGVAATVSALLAHAGPDMVVLGPITVAAMILHFREMSKWQYQDAEAERRRWARGL